jgi:hypothetical protein
VVDGQRSSIFERRPISVAMGAPGRNRVIAAFSDLVIKVCVAGGFTLGLLAGLPAHPHTPNCAKDDPCVGKQMSAAVWSVFGPAFAGAFAGLLAALFIVLALRRLRVRPEPARSSSEGSWINARYAGKCRRCARTTQRGEQVLWHGPGGGVTCAACVESR